MDNRWHRRTPLWAPAWGAVSGLSARGREGFHPPGAYFSHAGKVGKRALRGFAPKDPSFGNRVVERFVLEMMSVVGLPTNLGTLQQSACRPRRHKLRIACFRLSAKIRSLHCAISALSAAALRRLRSETPACGRVSFPHRTRCAGLRRGPRAAGQESSCFLASLAVYGAART